MKFARRFFAAFCLALCLASAGHCAEVVNPFKANEGGFGPKIKGLQLGTKMSLMELVEAGARLEKLPIELIVAQRDNDTFMSIDINITGKGKDITGFRLKRASGVFKPLEKKKFQKLEDLLSEIKKLGGETRLRGEHGFYNMIALNRDMRVTNLNFSKADFGAGALKNDEFVQELAKAYSIPNMEKDQEKGLWSYRDLSGGWEVVCGGRADLSLSAIVVDKPAFD